MKLKQLPSDFIVEELPAIELSQREKEHMIFLLEKKERDTFEALTLISSNLHIPLREIGVAGLKDKHAFTKQYISIPAKYDITSISLDNVRIQFVGYSNKKIKTGDLKGNRFTITVRNIKQRKLATIFTRAETVPSDGVPNYFDSQRFGSVFHKEFIAKYLIQRDFEHAVKIFLTSYLKSEKKHVKNEKRKILKHWNNLGHITVKNKVFASIIQCYLTTGSWCTAYKKIPAHLREMHVNAYQSFLWNECVKEVLKHHIDNKKLYPVKYAVGSLLFYTELTSSEKENIPAVFKTLSDNVKLSEFEKHIVKKILSRQGVTLKEFAIKPLTGNFFKSRNRQTLVTPQEFTISEPLPDELNEINGRPLQKIRVSFTLPKGSYATIVTKKIFGH